MIPDLHRPRSREPDEAAERGAQHAEVGAEGARPEAGQQREHREGRNRRPLQQAQAGTGGIRVWVLIVETDRAPKLI